MFNINILLAFLLMIQFLFSCSGDKKKLYTIFFSLSLFAILILAFSQILLLVLLLVWF